MQVSHCLPYDVVFASLQHIVAVRCLVSHVSLSVHHCGIEIVQLYIV